MNSFEELGNGLMLAHQGQQQLAEYVWQRLVAFFTRPARAAVESEQRA
jgi:hypothetical protein